MRLVNLAARDAQLTLTVADVFRFPVLADQAGLLQPLAQAKLPEPFELMMTSGAVSFADLVTSVAEQCRVSRSQVEDTYPCTPLQEEMMCVSLSEQRTQMGQEVTQLAESLDILRSRAHVIGYFNGFLSCELGLSGTRASSFKWSSRKALTGNYRNHCQNM